MQAKALNSNQKIVQLLALAILTTFILSPATMAQKLAMQGYHLSFHEFYQETIRNCSDNYLVYKGSIRVKYKSEKKDYAFYFADIGNNSSILTVKGDDNTTPLVPTISYEQLQNKLFIHKGKSDEVVKQLEDNLTDTQIILQAMFLWLNDKEKKISK